MPDTRVAAGPRALIDFAGETQGSARLRLAFIQPREVLEADVPSDVPAVLDSAHEHARQGRWCVGFVRYEAALAFDEAHLAHDAGRGPLAWFAVYDTAAPWPHDEPENYAPLHWRASLDRDAFEAGIARIHQAIADGEVYQVNFTSPVKSPFTGDAQALFHALHRAQPDCYAAFIDTGSGEQVLSVSPELFFDWRDGRVLARPMKGTAPRGRTAEEDAAQAERLLQSEKERAENLMIVDLLRNDLSRIARPFTVKVPALFERRAWPTVWQMTSDIVAETREGTRLSDVFGALFPCGSVTGAPKVRAMHWIRELEREPRGVYCGAIGVLQPGGAATFSVAIRTVEVNNGQARCGIGSGITADAQAESEWQEWRHKRMFLERASRPFELLQTLRLQDGRFHHLDEHLARMAQAARHFNYGWNEGDARATLDNFARSRPEGAWRVRWRNDARGRTLLEAFALPETQTPVKAVLAATPMAQAQSEFVRCKTTRREHYDAFAPTQPGVFDTLLWNEQGELTEFTRGNVAALIDGRWVTPPLHCGLLDGVGRAQALQEGRVTEAVVRVADLPRVQALAFVNSLRGWLPVELER